MASALSGQVCGSRPMALAAGPDFNAVPGVVTPFLARSSPARSSPARSSMRGLSYPRFSVDAYGKEISHEAGERVGER